MSTVVTAMHERVNITKYCHTTLQKNVSRKEKNTFYKFVNELTRYRLFYERQHFSMQGHHICVRDDYNSHY